MQNTSPEHPSLKQPAAWISIAISLVALSFLLVYVAIFGVSNSMGGDEGTPARIFQLLMLAQLPIIAYFQFKWLAKRPKESLLILALQAAAWVVPILAVLWLESL